MVKQFCQVSNDAPVDAITRLHARTYRDNLVASGAAPGTIETYISYLRTIFETAIREDLIKERVNPFKSLKIDKLVAPEEAREPIPRDTCLEILRQSLTDGLDEADWFAAVMITTGMRPIEAYKAKQSTEHGVPHWAIPRVKKSAPRVVPIHPLLLGLEPVPFTVRPEQLRRAFINRHRPYNNYQCRHSWNDEAARLAMPPELRLRAMGHSVGKLVGRNSVYGSAAVFLPEIKKWIDRMWAE